MSATPVTFIYYRYEDQLPVRIKREKLISCPWNKMKNLAGQMKYDFNDVENIRFNSLGEYTTSNPLHIAFLSVYNNGGIIDMHKSKVAAHGDPDAAQFDITDYIQWCVEGRYVSVKPSTIMGVYVDTSLPKQEKVVYKTERVEVETNRVPREVLADLPLKNLRSFAASMSPTMDVSLDKEALLQKLIDEGFVK